MFNIIKIPVYENDDMLLNINSFWLSNEKLKLILDSDEYLKEKFNKFKNKDINFEGFERFKDRPSFRNANLNTQLAGSIYTFAVEDRNGLNYEQSLISINSILDNNNKSRKAILRMVNPIWEYERSEHFGKLDVSCLSLIHYYDGDVKLIFRASDIENELFADIITLYWFFIKPIYNKINITIYASTAQNIEYVHKLKEKINKWILHETK